MEPFGVDKSFYDIGVSDLKELWDSDMDTSVCELRVSDEDWSNPSLLAVKPQVILHDRLMSDALLSETPIKAEHSYCSIQTESSPPNSPLLKKDMDVEDEEDLYLPAVAPKTASGISALNEKKHSSSQAPLSVVVVKAEPISEPESPSSSCPPSPSPVTPQTPFIYADIKYEKKNFNHSVLKQPTVVITTKSSLKKKQISMHNVIKVEPTVSGFSLPPTPPSSTSSDSEGNVSPLHPSSPSRRLFLSANSSSNIRQPIQTPLISTQPKGSTGTLFLTEEEKRTLLAEGYPIPVRLPLTKAEEKSLKKIRRKIKNKISAQESRRKKKEYMDALERKVQILSSENSDYRKKITSLEDANSNLLSQLNKLQTIIARSHSGINIRNMHK